LTVGSDVQFCAAAPAKAPSTTNDTTRRFVGVRNAPPPATCPTVPGGGSPSGAFLDHWVSLWK
jgi:hypothetical protein